MDDARRRASFKQGRTIGCGDVSFRGETLGSFLTKNLYEGTCPDRRPVDEGVVEPLPPGEFVVVSRCGTWKDTRIQRVFDERFGPNEWRMGYSWGEHTVDVRSGIDLYEDGYRAALAADPALVEWVCGFAEVFDTAPSNVAAFCDYSIQEVEGAGQHWQDVAVRRALIRLGRWFEGDALLEIRGQDSGGYRLNPGQLEYYKSEWIVEPRQYAWWKRDSIEDFSVSNFCVQASLPRVLAWMRGAPMDEERYQTMLVAQHPELLSEVPRMRAAGVRGTWVAARTLSLMDAYDFLATQDDSGLVEVIVRIQRLSPFRQQLLDRLLADDPLTRREAFAELLRDEDREYVRWMLQVVEEDPARKMRARARAAL